MNLLVGAFAVLFVLIVAEALPPVLRPPVELVLIGVSSAVISVALFEEVSVEAASWAFGVAGLTLVLQATYRLARAWADRTEVANLLQMRRQPR